MMKKHSIIISVLALSTVSLVALATERMWIQRNDRIALAMPIEMADSVAITSDGSGVVFTTTSENRTITKSEITDITFVTDNGTPAVEITFDGTDAEIINPYAFEGITVAKTGADVVVTSTTSEEITYQLSGTTTSGSFKIYSDKKFKLNLNSVNITNDNGAAINIQSGKKCTLILSGTSNLTDASSYTSENDEDQKSCFFSEGQIIIKGDGILNINANYKHGLCSDDYIDIQSGTVNILKAANDGVRVNDYFLMTGGTLTTVSTTGDGIDGDEGYIQIDGGTIDITIATADTKCIKCDSIITMNGGNVKLTVPADQGKGFKTKQSMTVNGGTITADLSGAAVVVSYDPSYCTAIKTDADFTMNDGTINITHTGVGGKGISVDGTTTFNGGNVNITTSGNGATYTATSGTDTYNATCITSDGNLYLNGGTFNLVSSGTAGKCIKTDLQLIANPTDANALTVYAETKGSQLGQSSNQPGGGGGGGGRPGRPGQTTTTNDSSSSPKVIKSTGDMTINGGNFTIKSASEGGEGLESKATMTINGGDFYFNTYDDCINAAVALNITGGNIRAVATGNDAIDSNGTMAISGGLLLASGTREPEEGIDVDQASKLSITGGTVINQKGNMLNLTTTQCKVPTVKYSSSISSGTLVTITDASGNHIVSFKAPQAMSQGCYITHPNLKSGNSYKLYTGGSVSGGTVFNEVSQGGSYTAGTLKKSFTISSNLTSL